MPILSLEDDLRGVAFGVVLEDVAAPHLTETDIGQGWFFRKASPKERSDCKRVVGSINSLIKPMDFPSEPQELEFIPREQGSGIDITQIKNPDDWRYFVVVPGDNPTLHTHQVTEALKISNAELTVEHWGQNMEGLNGIRGPISVPYPTFSLSGLEIETRHIDFDEVKECLNLRGSLDEDCFKPISMALIRFLSLGRLPRSDMKLLGYFGVIESLLSHAPKANDSADSISQQLKRNLILIENRLPDSEKIGQLLNDGTPDRAFITKLYSYRSDLAHGNISMSSRDKLAQKFGGIEGIHWDICIDNFLRTLVRRILKQALREPQLVTDLKG
jgi:hypothetical protein